MLLMRKVGLRSVAVLMAALAVGGCSAGLEAPAAGDPSEACIVDFCVAYPAGWEVVESGDRFISFVFSDADTVVATVGRVNLEGIATNAGASWPQPARDVVELLWSLLDGGEAELARVDLVRGGSLDSWGFISSGRLWHRLVPISASRGYGIEVRAPNASWEPHADVFRSGLVVLNTEL